MALRRIEVCYTWRPRSPSPEQSVEAPVVGVYREHLHLAEARLSGVLTKYRGTHDGSSGGSLRVSHGAGQAGDHAPAVLSSFPGEAGTLNSSATSPSATSRVPSSESIRAAESASTGRDMSCSASRIVTRSYPPAAELGGVRDGEPHSIIHASPFCIPASSADGVRVEIDTVHVDVGVRLRHGDARPAGAARHIDDPRCRFAPKPHVYVDDRRQPFVPSKLMNRGRLHPPGLRAPMAAAARFQPEMPPPAGEASDRRERSRGRYKPHIGCRRGLRVRGCAPAAASTGERVVPPAGRRPRASHSRRAALATPARTARWFQSVRQALRRWPHHFRPVPDTARVVHRDRSCRAPTPHWRTTAHATHLRDQRLGENLRRQVPLPLPWHLYTGQAWSGAEGARRGSMSSPVDVVRRGLALC